MWGAINFQGNTWMSTKQMTGPLHRAVRKFEEKSSQLTLEEWSERRYRNVFENTGTAMVIFAPDMTISMTNSEFEKLAGYSRKEAEGKLKWKDLVDKHDLEKLKAYLFENQSEEERPREFEFRLKDKHGQIKDIFLKVGTIPGMDENVASIMDVTDRKRAEEALKTSEEKYRQLVIHAPAGIYEVDFVNQKFITVNDVMCEYTGYSREEFLSLSPFDILTEDSKKRFLERMSKVLAGEPVPETVEYEIRGKGGRKFWVILNAKLVYQDGMPKGAAVVVYDITERKMAELAVKESEEKYRLLVENANDGIFIAQDGKIKFPNPKTREILGYSAGELLQIPYIELIHPDDRALIAKRRNKKSTEQLSQPSTYSLRVIPRSGKQIWTQISSVPITWESRPATLNFVRDITLQKKAEQELKQSLAKLRRITGATIQAMVQTVEVRDPYTAGHQRRVGDLARAIATHMKLTPGQIDCIRMAGAIHDIGKISVPAEILSKPGSLTDLEFNLIKSHPSVGYDILKGIDFPWDIATIVLQHHEKLDGSGYPQGLSEENILPEARTLVVADVVEAMASHRPYRPALGIERALEEISAKKGLLYDPDAVDTCIRLFKKKGFKFKN